MAKQIATASPGRPMPVISFSVPRRPSRQTMKAIRKAAAQTERQNTTVQLSGASMKRAIAPPKLQKIADSGDQHKADALVAHQTGLGVRRRDLSFGRLTHDAYGRQLVAAGKRPGSQSVRTIQ